MAMQSSISTEAPRRGRKPGAFIVRDTGPEGADAPIDWSAWYLTDEEDMGEGAEQGVIVRVFLSALEQLAAERRWTNLFIAGDQFFAWVRAEPMVRVSPDVYLLDDPPAPPLPKMWQTWLPGHNPPRWAVEVVSDDWKKDYDDAPLKYAQLGSRELVIFDPEACHDGGAGHDPRPQPRPPAEASTKSEPRARRVPLQVYRRAADGAFVRVYSGAGPAPSDEIDAFLVVQRVGETVRLRIARDARGLDLVPTLDEAKRAAEADKQQAEERATSAEERVRALEAELARLRGGA